MLKQFYLWSAALLLMFALCGCREKENPNIYDVSYDGKNYTVDQGQRTIICDEVVYGF